MEFPPRINKVGFSKKKQYSQISNIGGLYSAQKVLSRRINQTQEDCADQDVIPRPPINSGVHDYKYPGYYYDARVPYLTSL